MLLHILPQENVGNYVSKYAEKILVFADTHLLYIGALYRGAHFEIKEKNILSSVSSF